MAALLLVTWAAFPLGAQNLSGSDDPYMGSGTTMPPPPEQLKIYDRGMISSFQLGTTTKNDVIEVLGKPGAWNSDSAGNSLLVYMYRLNSPELTAQGVTQSVGVRLRFDAKKTLTKIELPNN